MARTLLHALAIFVDIASSLVELSEQECRKQTPIKRYRGLYRCSSCVTCVAFGTGYRMQDVCSRPRSRFRFDGLRRDRTVVSLTRRRRCTTAVVVFRGFVSIIDTRWIWRRVALGRVFAVRRKPLTVVAHSFRRPPVALKMWNVRKNMRAQITSYKYVQNTAKQCTHASCGFRISKKTKGKPKRNQLHDNADFTIKTSAFKNRKYILFEPDMVIFEIA